MNGNGVWKWVAVTLGAILISTWSTIFVMRDRTTPGDVRSIVNNEAPWLKDKADIVSNIKQLQTRVDFVAKRVDDNNETLKQILRAVK